MHTPAPGTLGLRIIGRTYPGGTEQIRAVRALADEWGIDGDHTSRTIWARFDWPEHP